MASILVSDDAGEARAALRFVLQRAHHTTCTAPGGTHTLAMLDKEPFDLLITDLENAHMDGRALIAEVGKRFPKLPVMVVSASRLRRRGQSGVNDRVFESEVAHANVKTFVRKPFDVEEILQAVRHALGKHSPGA